MSHRDMAPVERNLACDGRWSMQPSLTPRLQRANQRYYAEVPVLALEEQIQLIEQLIGLAFDALGARHLDVRVHGPGQAGGCATHHRGTVGMSGLSANDESVLLQ